MEHILGPPIPLSAFPSLFSSYIDTSDKTKRKSIVITTSRMRVSKHRYIRLFVAPWTVARQASLSMELPRQEYWSGLPLTSPGDLSNLGIEPESLALQADSLPPEPPGKPKDAKHC